MLKYIRKHLQSNRGDAHVSKMTMIAIVFVVGAILLVMTTSAFRSPVNNWFQKVTAGWFADSNGMYEADSAFPGYQRAENGTYQGLVYVYTQDNGHRIVLKAPADLQNGYTARFEYDIYAPDGRHLGNTGHSGNIVISADGTTITDGSWTFIAETP